jgi:hypothetical protein
MIDTLEAETRLQSLGALIYSNMDVWAGSIQLKDGSSINDIHIFSHGTESTSLSSASSLHFLAVVQISELPLSLVAGPSHSVWSLDEKSKDWFSGILLQEPSETPSTSWFDWCKESFAGILVRIADSTAESEASELLFYGVITNADAPTLQVRALPLCSAQSRLLNDHETPPASREVSPRPKAEEIIRGKLLNHAESLAPTKAGSKRPTTADVFDAANELRRRIRGKGGAGIAQVAAGLLLTQSAALNPAIVKRDRPKRIQLDRQSSLTSQTLAFVNANVYTRSSTLPVLHKNQNVFAGTNRTKIERTKSLPHTSASASLEQMNRDAISNLVMKGMRMYGFQPKKKPEKDPESLQDLTGQGTEDDYKLVYHQTFKAAVFAFVSRGATENTIAH